jgi:hypothetical protein
LKKAESRKLTAACPRKGKAESQELMNQSQIVNRKFVGVRVAGNAKLLLCAADAFDLAAGDHVNIKIGTETVSGTVTVPPGLLEVVQPGENVPEIIEVCSGVGSRTETETDNGAAPARCNRQPCCADWVARFT